ncbi:MAG: class I SAM-dependent methyltransferase [Firmicutes bacterium]|nr:class I SAM-dependent methyltransferase [Bacillota bacterium]
MHGRYEHWRDPEKLRRLDQADREQMMPKAPVLAALRLEAGLRVADIGAGVGYFALPIAVAVGRHGLVEAVDPSPAARAELGRRAREADLNQVVVRDGHAAATGLEDASMDRILWHAMCHEVPDRHPAVVEMWRILKPGGLWVVVDWKPEPMEKGPPMEDRVAPEVVEKEAASVGFSLLERFKSGPVTYGLVFVKPQA